MKTLSHATFIAALCLATLAAAAEPAASLPEWIWSSNKPGGNEVVYFRRTFELDKAVKEAKLLVSCDNVFTAWVNGEQVAKGNAWQAPSTTDVTKRLTAGSNVVAIRGQNEGGIAALLSRLDITYADGAKQSIITDGAWRVATAEATNWQQTAFAAADWKAAHSFGKLGREPWGNVFNQPGAGPVGEATAADQLTLLPGFKAERLYSVPKPEQGSWVSMTFDPKGRIITSDQGGPLYRISLPHASQEVKVEKLDVAIGHAQGLLHVGNDLYVTVNGNAAQGNGLYRVRDTNSDDQYDEVKLLKKIEGGGEHGPHGIVLGPDKQSLYLVAGNFTKPPKDFLSNSPHRNWAEDLLLERMPDGGGHDPHVMAPGGWVSRTDLEGRDWTFLCAGLRNAYDIAFNQDGELFTYDSDMEWDVGAPWYRPTRVNHIVSGADYGWRNGSGKWPSYYPDSLPGYDIGLGSPTGVAFGTSAKFPAKYQRALYVLDWTYGRIYAMHFTPKGAGYTATFEQFCAAKPLPVTDIAVGPDGGLYFTIGGRGTQSGLYRITYAGDEPTTPVGPLVDEKATAARAVRHKLEAFHGRQDPTAIAAAWPYLDNPDRNLRYAARVAIEHQEPSQWVEKALTEKRSTKLINALVAVCRTGPKELQPRVLEALGRLNFAALSEEQQLEALRVYGLAFIRMGKPETARAAEVLARLEPQYPSKSDPVNRELVQLLVYLESPTVVARSMELLSSALTQEEQMHYVFVLRLARAGWTPELRKGYFSWLNLAAEKYPGGHSFKPFLDNIRKGAVATLSEDEKIALKSVIEGQQRVQVVRDEKPRKFIHNWQIEDLLPVLGQASSGRNFAVGKAAFQATQCARCHRFKNDGGGVGHDLTGVGNRFSNRDLLESIILPSKVISDQYASKTVVTTEGQTFTGLVGLQPDGSASVFQSNGQTVSVPKDQIDEIVPSPVSTMPEGLVSVLTKEEILDLIAYLRAAGDPNDKVFAK